MGVKCSSANTPPSMPVLHTMPLSAAAERILTADCNNDGFYTAPIIDIVQTHVVHYISLLAEIQQEEEIQWEK